MNMKASCDSVDKCHGVKYTLNDKPNSITIDSARIGFDCKYSNFDSINSVNCIIKLENLQRLKLY